MKTKISELIEAYEEHIKLLVDEINEIGYAASHGWKTSRYEIGKTQREKIALLKAEVERSQNKKL